jgi:hypothetical protein
MLPNMDDQLPVLGNLSGRALSGQAGCVLSVQAGSVIT